MMNAAVIEAAAVDAAATSSGFSSSVAVAIIAAMKATCPTAKSVSSSTGFSAQPSLRRHTKNLR
jgi:hypothetical protein